MTETNPIPRAGRKKSRRHPLLWGRPKDVWHADLVGKVPGYPKTQEAFDKRRKESSERFKKMWAEGKLEGRKGVPDGWAGRKHEVEAIRAKAAHEATELIKIMAEQGIINETEVSNEALHFAVSVIRDGQTYQARERLAAARLVLDFTKAKPVSKQEVTVKRAEDFLADLANGVSPENG